MELLKHYCSIVVRKKFPDELAPYGKDLDELLDATHQQFLDQFEARSKKLTPLNSIWKYRAFDKEDMTTQAEIWEAALNIRIQLHHFFQDHPEGSLELAEKLWGNVIRCSLDAYEFMYPTRHVPNVGKPADKRYDALFEMREAECADVLEKWDTLKADGRCSQQRAKLDSTRVDPQGSIVDGLVKPVELAIVPVK